MIVVCRNIHSDLRVRMGRPNARVLRQQGTPQLGRQRHRAAVVGVRICSIGLYSDIYIPWPAHRGPWGRRTNVLIDAVDLANRSLADSDCIVTGLITLYIVIFLDFSEFML